MGMDNLIIYQKMYDLILYSVPIINWFPTSQRYVLGQQIQNCMLEIASLIVRANKSQQYRKAKIFDIDTELEKLRLLLRLANDLGFMSIKKYGIHAGKVDETCTSDKEKDHVSIQNHNRTVNLGWQRLDRRYHGKRLLRPCWCGLHPIPGEAD